MSDHRVSIVADLSYGDAGKGSVIDFLARQDRDSPFVVRFNGGAQAAHNVVTEDGIHHTFSQFGSASLIPGARTHLSRFMLVNPLRLAAEADQLSALGVASPHQSVTIDRRALVITPYHEGANRLREIFRGPNRHGSCGHGIGETMADFLAHPDEALTVGDMLNPKVALAKLEQARARKLAEFADIRPILVGRDAALADLADQVNASLSRAVVDFYSRFVSCIRIVGEDYLPELLRTTPHALFEGAQGVLLDESRGFHPYTTWSKTTFHNANTILEEAAYDGDVQRIGLFRAYVTRHGAGPFVTEDPVLTDLVPDAHNQDNAWQHEFRVGHFDLLAARYAIQVSEGVDQLGITCLDRPVPRQVAVSYRHGGDAIQTIQPSAGKDLDYQARLTDQLLGCTPVYESAPATDAGYLDYLEAALGLPVTVTSSGPTAAHKSFRLSSLKR